MKHVTAAEIITVNGEKYEIPFDCGVSEEKFTSELLSRDVVGVYGKNNDYFVFPTRNIICVHFFMKKEELPKSNRLTANIV